MYTSWFRCHSGTVLLSVLFVSVFFFFGGSSNNRNRLINEGKGDGKQYIKLKCLSFMLFYAAEFCVHEMLSFSQYKILS